MLISFAVENYLSIKDRVELSMQVLSDKYNDNNELSENYQTFSLSEKEDKKYNILKSALIYGLNASGKTNILHALKVFTQFVVTSFERGNQSIPVTPFRLDSNTCKKPSTFEATILVNGTYYRYGFSATREYIFKEWLFSSTKGRESRIFFREKKEDSEDYNFFNSKFRSLHKQVRSNSLLLTVSSLNNITEAKEIISYLENFIFHKNNKRVLPEEQNRTLVQDVIKNIDIGITSLQYKKATQDDIDDMKKKLPLPEGVDNDAALKFKEDFINAVSEREFLMFEYKDNEGKIIPLPEKVQSTGTRVIFSLISKLLNSYTTPCTIIIDEIEESLHPLLLKYFFNLFHAIPNNNIQLICTTHNVLLLSEGFRRDQIYITEKDEHLATSLVSIGDFTGVRKNANLLKLYLDGHFGGVPTLSDLDIRKFVNSLSKG